MSQPGPWVEGKCLVAALEQVSGGLTSRYFYDCFGRLDEITTEDRGRVAVAADATADRWPDGRTL